MRWQSIRHKAFLFFNTYARLGISGGIAKAYAQPGAKRPRKAKKPTCLAEALAETEACLPVTA